MIDINKRVQLSYGVTGTVCSYPFFLCDCGITCQAVRLDSGHAGYIDNDSSKESGMPNIYTSVIIANIKDITEIH